MKSGTRSEFYNILVQNNEEEIREYLIKHGKNPKHICPIQFIIKKEEDKNNE